MFLDHGNSWPPKGTFPGLTALAKHIFLSLHSAPGTASASSNLGSRFGQYQMLLQEWWVSYAGGIYRFHIHHDIITIILISYYIMLCYVYICILIYYIHHRYIYHATKICWHPSWRSHKIQPYPEVMRKRRANLKHLFKYVNHGIPGAAPMDMYN